MTLSVCVFDEVNVQDVVVAIQFVTITRTPDFSSIELELSAKETAITPVDNNSPPVFQETLGIAIREEVQTKEALS